MNQNDLSKVYLFRLWPSHFVHLEDLASRLVVIPIVLSVEVRPVTGHRGVDLFLAVEAK